MAHKHRWTTAPGTGGQVQRCSCGKRKGRIEVTVPCGSVRDRRQAVTLAVLDLGPRPLRRTI